MSKKKDGQIYRLLPCSRYDARSLERWLEEMSLEGLLLVKNSYSRGRVAFRQIEPHAARYRLQVTPKHITEMARRRTGGEDDGDGGGDRRAAWYSAGTLGEFYVYRSVTSDERDRGSDLIIRAMALDRAKKRLLFDGALALVCFAAYPLLLRGLLLAMVRDGTWMYLLGAAAVLWLFLDSLCDYVRERRLYRVVETAGRLPPVEVPPMATGYYGKNAAQMLLVAAVLAAVLAHWILYFSGADRVYRSDWTGRPPFAVMEDLPDRPVEIYQVTSARYSQVRAWGDLLSARNYDWSENARLTLKGGEILEGGLYVDYHETWTPALAQCLADAYIRRDGDFRELDLPDAPADFAMIRDGDPQFPILVFRKGSVAVRVLFYQSSTYQIPLEEWAATCINAVPNIT